MREAGVLAGSLVFALACGDAGLPAGSGRNLGNGGQASGATLGSGSSAGTSGSTSGSSAGTSGSSAASSGSSGGSGGSSAGATGGGLPTVGGIFQQPEPWTEDVSGLPKEAKSDAIIAAPAPIGRWGNGHQLQIEFSIPGLFGAK